MKRPILAVLPLLFFCGRALAQCPGITWSAPVGQSGNTAHDLVTVDFNNDGKLDLVGEVRDSGSGVEALYSWVGHGDGTFDAPVSMNESSVRDVAVADLNQDGRNDIVIATWRGVISARLNTGSGFGPSIITETTSYQGDRIAVGKFDSDAYPDVVVGSYYSNIFVIYHGVGNGAFTEIRRNAAKTPLPLAAADFDGDGRGDVAYVVREEKNVYVDFRNADGTFAPPLTLPAVDFPSDLATGDFNEDGKQDLVAVNWEEFVARPLHSVMVFIAGPSRTFTRSIMTANIINSTSSYASVKVADLNGDHHLDIVAFGTNGNVLLTYLGQGDGTFRSATHTIGTFDTYNISLGDVDGDGRPDLILGGWSGIGTMKNNCATHVHLYSVSPVITAGQTAPLRALIGSISANTPQPRGTVTFKEGAVTLGTADVDVDGIAQLEAAGLTLGTHTIRAEFSGNTELVPAFSADISQQVVSGSSSIRINLPAGGSTYGAAYPITVTVSSYYGSTYDGWVSVYVDGVEAVHTWSGSAMSLNLPTGPHVLTAHYYGDILQPPSNSSPSNIVTAKATAALSYTGTLTVRQGTAHAIAVQVTGPQGTTPTGTVQLMRGATVLASAAVVNGNASLSPTLERGTHELTAVYSGDGNFTASSQSLTLTVVQNATIALEARGLPNAISIRVVLPANATNVTLYRRLGGTTAILLPVNGWTPAVEFDTTAARGVLYDYRVEATVNGIVQASAIDSAILFTDDGLVSAAKVIHHTHFDELRLAVNALRATAGLALFDYDSLASGALIRAVHLAALRNALTEARQTLGMVPPTYTDAAAPGTIVKAVQIQELRELAR